jgi:hypothetical protein
MGWGVSFEGYVSRVTKRELPAALEDAIEYQQRLQKELLFLAGFTVGRKVERGKKAVSVENLAEVRVEFESLLDELMEVSGKLTLMTQASQDEGARDT